MYSDHENSKSNIMNNQFQVWIATWGLQEWDPRKNLSYRPVRLVFLRTCRWMTFCLTRIRRTEFVRCWRTERCRWGWLRVASSAGTPGNTTSRRTTSGTTNLFLLTFTSHLVCRRWDTDTKMLLTSTFALTANTVCERSAIETKLWHSVQNDCNSQTITCFDNLTHDH